MPDSSSILSNRFRSTLALCVLAATPAATCGITLNGLLLRVQAIEASHWIVVDAEGREIGSAIDQTSVLVQRDGFKPLLLNTPPAHDPHFPLWGNSGGLFFESADCSGTPYLGASSNSLAGAAYFDPDFGLVGEIEGSTSASRMFYSNWDWETNRCYESWGGQGIGPVFSVEGALVEGFETAPPLRLVTLAGYYSGESRQ